MIDRFSPLIPEFDERVKKLITFDGMPLDVAVASAGHRVEEEEDQGLPEGWIVQFDPTSGANYYTNISTGETSWTPPAS